MPLTPRYEYLMKRRKEIYDEMERHINDLQQLIQGTKDIEARAEFTVSIGRELEKLLKELEEVNREMRQIPKVKPTIGLEEVRQLLEDECEVWQEYTRRFPGERPFGELADMCRLALKHFKERNWNDAYYVLVDMYLTMVEWAEKLKPIMADIEDKPDIYYIELAHIRELAQWVSDMRYKGERLAGIEELGGWRR